MFDSGRIQSNRCIEEYLIGIRGVIGKGIRSQGVAT